MTYKGHSHPGELITGIISRLKMQQVAGVIHKLVKQEQALSAELELGKAWITTYKLESQQ